MKPFCILMLGLLLLVGRAFGLTVVPRSFDELVDRADSVFRGTVVRLDPKWIGESNDRRIVTYVTFHVEDTYKGDVAVTQTLRFLGGTIGDTTMMVPEMPKFTVGQSAVLFVTGNGKQFCPLVGIHQGRFHVTRDAAGIERVTTNDGLPVVNTAKIGRFQADGTPTLLQDAQDHVPAMTADQFKSEILERLADGARNQPVQPNGVQP